MRQRLLCVIWYLAGVSNYLLLSIDRLRQSSVVVLPHFVSDFRRRYAQDWIVNQSSATVFELRSSLLLKSWQSDIDDQNVRK
jgi:hypothetical protein